MIRYILFDFDGTLVDSKQIFVASYNQLAEKYGFNKIDAGNIDYLRKLPMMERFKFLNVPFYKLPFLTKQFLSLYESGIAHIHLIDGLKTVLEKIADTNVRIGIVSSNSVSIIQNFVAQQNIPVDDVYCSGRLFGKDRLFRKFLKDKKLSPSEVLYVCDELRDIQACNKVRIRPIWVSWGFEMEEALTPGNIAFTAHTPAALFSIIENEITRSRFTA